MSQEREIARLKKALDSIDDTDNFGNDIFASVRKTLNEDYKSYRSVLRQQKRELRAVKKLRREVKKKRNVPASKFEEVISKQMKALSIRKRSPVLKTTFLKPELKSQLVIADDWENQSVEVTFDFAAGEFEQKFKSYEHAQHWLESSLNTFEDSQGKVSGDELSDVFDSGAVITVKRIRGATRTNKSKTMRLRGMYHDLICYSPKSKTDNCGIACVDKLLKLKKDKYRVRSFRAKYKVIGALTPEQVNQYYTENGGEELVITSLDNFYGLDCKHTILYHKNHYSIVKRCAKKEKKSVKRGTIFLDLESRPWKELVPGSWRLRDTITKINYKPFRAEKYTVKHFETEKERSSCQLFLEWLKEEYFQGRYYCIYAHNGGNFDYYFIINQLNKMETEEFEPVLRGFTILQMNYLNNIFRDTCAFLTNSLSNLCKDFGLAKKYSKQSNIKLHGKRYTSAELCFYKPELKFDEFMQLRETDPKYWKKYLKYCEMDTVSLQLIWEKFSESVDLLAKKVCVSLKDMSRCSVASCITIGSLAKRLFMASIKGNKYFDEYLLFHQDYEEYLRNFKQGGISFCKKGTYNSSMSKFDVKSQYPNAAVTGRLPVGEAKWSCEYIPGTFGYIHFKYIKFGNKVLKPVASRNEDGTNNWSSDCVKDAYMTSYHFEYLMEHHDVTDYSVREYLYSEKDIDSSKITSRYFNTIYSDKEIQDQLKAAGSEEYNPAYRQAIKLLLNSLTGKFVEDKGKHTTLNFVKKSNITLNGLPVEEEPNRDSNDLVAIGVMIYEESKRQLFDYMLLLPNASADVVQVETDAFMAPTEDCDLIYTGQELGDLELEGVSGEVPTYIIRKKSYCWFDGKEDHLQMNGIPKTTINQDGSELELLTRETYKDLAEGKNVCFRFNRLKKVLYSKSVGVDALTVHRTVKGVGSNENSETISVGLK